MAKKGKKQVMVAFRVDPHLAEELDRLPDKSGFIRQAIERAFHVACPVCEGRGTVSHETTAYVTELLRAQDAERCSCCGSVFPTKGETGAGAESDDHAPDPLPIAEHPCGHCGEDEHQH
ncbi:MAG: hypothetical protein ACYTDX_01515 [Planctomycetota bacterium]|jgi:hypothetical protein